MKKENKTQPAHVHGPVPMSKISRVQRVGRPVDRGGSIKPGEHGKTLGEHSHMLDSDARP